MALINNWDLKDSNNAVYQEKHNDGSTAPEQIYLVSDLGASFGTTGFVLSHEKSRGNLSAYDHSGFIGNRTPNYVDFKAPSRPALIETFNPPVFIHRVDLRWIGRHIPRADAKWMGELLGRFSRRISYAMRSAPRGTHHRRPRNSLQSCKVESPNSICCERRAAFRVDSRRSLRWRLGYTMEPCQRRSLTPKSSLLTRLFISFATAVAKQNGPPLSGLKELRSARSFNIRICVKNTQNSSPPSTN
jgi:hypothetical protein